MHDGDKREPDDSSNYGNVDCCIILNYPYGFSGRNTTIYQSRSLPIHLATDMTPKGISYDPNAKDHHESEIVLQTIESSHEYVQLRRFSQRILAASVASLPIFERSPAPSPPPSEERNAFRGEQRVQIGAATPQQCQGNKSQLRRIHD